MMFGSQPLQLVDIPIIKKFDDRIKLEFGNIYLFLLHQNYLAAMKVATYLSSVWCS